MCLEILALPAAVMRRTVPIAREELMDRDGTGSRHPHHENDRWVVVVRTNTTTYHHCRRCRHPDAVVLVMDISILRNKRINIFLRGSREERELYCM